MRFLADVGVDQRVVDWLREQGHEVAHLRDEGLHRMADEDVFAKAIAEDRIVLTFDLDFGEIAALSRGRKASVVLFRLHNTRTRHRPVGRGDRRRTGRARGRRGGHGRRVTHSDSTVADRTDHHAAMSVRRDPGTPSRRPPPRSSACAGRSSSSRHLEGEFHKLFIEPLIVADGRIDGAMRFLRRMKFTRLDEFKTSVSSWRSRHT